MATKVKLRKKKISGNRFSLYLDFYPAIFHPEKNKTTRREFLNLFIHEKPKTQLEKQYNVEVLEIAEAIRAKRHIAILNSDFEFLKKKSSLIDFMEYFREVANKKKTSNYDSWISSLKHFEDFAGGALYVKDLNLKTCKEFKEYLLNARNKKYKNKNVCISRNSASSYFDKFVSLLKQAYDEEVINTNLAEKITRIEEVETQREYLSIEELERLVNTICENPILKKAALFSALTGIAHKEICMLKWGDIRRTDEYGYFIPYKRKKSDRYDTLTISEQAYNLLGDRRADDKFVFEGLHYSDSNNRKLYKWISDAGIRKYNSLTRIYLYNSR